MTEENTVQIARPLISVAELIERSLTRFSRLFSGLFPWLVLSCLGGFLVVLGKVVIPSWERVVITLVGLIIVLLSYLAEARIVAGVESEPKDIIGNGRHSLTLFFPYIWVIILQSLILLGGVIVIGIPSFIFAIYLVVMLFVFIVEGRRGLSTLARSWGYVSGRWWATLWRVIVLLFLVLVVTVLISTILGLIVGVNAGPAGSFGAALVEQLIGAFLLGPWLLSYLFEFYHDLRTTKPTPSVIDGKTARLWLVIFLTIGIIVALILIFGSVTHTAARGFRNQYYYHQI